MNKKENSDFKDNVKIINNNKNTLNINTFIKLIKAAPNFNNFKNYKI